MTESRNPFCKVTSPEIPSRVVVTNVLVQMAMAGVAGGLFWVLHSGWPPSDPPPCVPVGCHHGVAPTTRLSTPNSASMKPQM